MRIEFEEAVAAASEVLVRLGIPDDHAELQSRILVEADARNHASHGVRRLDMLVRRIRAGRIEPLGDVATQWRTASVLNVDARNALGPVAAMAAIDQLIERVPDTGIAIAAVSGSNHLGMLAHYVEHIAKHGFIGLALTTSEALVHPWGGADAMIGTNPIGIGIPAGDQPLILDMSTAEVSAGKIIAHMMTGSPLQAGWAVDAEGLPTLDPSSAMDGSLSPFGGPKGYGLGLAFEVLVASLTGTSYGQEKHGTLDADHDSTKGDLFIVIDPKSFRDDFDTTEIAAYLDCVRNSRTPMGGASIRIPGDRSRADRAGSLANGVDINDEVWRSIQEQLKSLTIREGAGQHA